MILEAHQITKGYFNGGQRLLVLKGLDLVVEPGKIVTIMGPSGAGKTTLLNILGTLDKPDRGTLKINGQDVLALSDEALAKLRNREIGFVFQFHHLLPEFTALENVLMPAMIGGLEEQKHPEALELFKYVGLEARMRHYPSELSGGERLRVAVMRALINRPRLILADEPTGNLDVENARRLLQLFQKINADFKQTLIITTQNPEVARIGHEYYILEQETLRSRDSV
jgi:lipoprotein-releasing system ATP-binding protein